MLDITFIKENLQLVTDSMVNKGEESSPLVQQVIDKDEQWRGLVHEVDTLRAQSNKSATNRHP